MPYSFRSWSALTYTIQHNIQHTRRRTHNITEYTRPPHAQHNRIYNIHARLTHNNRIYNIHNRIYNMHTLTHNITEYTTYTPASRTAHSRHSQCA